MPPQPSAPERSLAIICQTVPPYRRHLHHRLVSEIPELTLVTINTHEDKSRDWRLDEDTGIGLVNLTDASQAGTTAGRSRIGRMLSAWRQGGEAIQELEKHRAAAVVVNGYNDPGRLRVIRWCHRNKTPCFIWGDSNVCGERLISATKKSIKRRYIQWLAKRVTGFIGCGRYGTDYFTSYGVEPARVFVAPYEPDYSLITDLPTSYVEQVASELGLSPARRRLLFCGRLVDVKRPDLLVDAFVQIAGDRPDWDLVMLGDGPLKELLLARLPATVAERVHWIPFTNDQRRVSAIYRACDVLVLPSDYEPWALVINEAVAAGLAVVSTDVVGAAVELVVDGKNGRLVPPSDLDALRDALGEVTDGTNIDRMKQASRGCLEEWQRRGDPVAGYRQALQYAGVL
ncbi:glycosyltransferase family 4 protein [Aeoliella sp. SH292]|uniref:glycosyltransferase family 4 protein n=1 Tax=Aeoliella sp. SH292 TaxID=3454464 RepID=UPI003F98837F